MGRNRARPGRPARSVRLVLRVEFIDGETKLFKGDVTLMR
jgi:hypothetical protein